MPFVQNGQIALNIGSTATRNLTMNNEGIQFSARFSGVSHEVRVPWSAVMGVFARETGEGMGFDLEVLKNEAVSNVSNVPEVSAPGVAADKSVKKPTLTVIK